MKKVFLTFLFLFYLVHSFSQVNAFVNSSFENFDGCVADMSPRHSQFGNVVFGWENAFASNVSTADFFTNKDSCSFTGFSSLTNTVSLASNAASIGCSWAGIYLNYYDTSSINAKYREYIAQNISLISGITYTVELDLARSNHPTSNTLEVDLAIYGYNGPIPAGQLDYCLINANGTPATVLGTISRGGIGSAFQTFSTSFTPSDNFDYLVIGGANCGTEATAIGYVFIDNVQLTANNSSILNPVIESCSGNGLCGLKCFKQSFDLVGNASQNGIISTWSQSSSNPEQITFTNPNSSTTNIVETGSFITGNYEFYYTFSNGVTSVTDTVSIDIFEFKTVNVFDVGADINNCNGNADGTGMARGVQVFSALPESLDIVLDGAIVWWSMIRQDGTEWTFPNGCNPGDGSDEGDVYTTNGFGMQCGTISDYTTNSNEPIFAFRNAQDTIQFIFHLEVTDDCNYTIVLSDTMTVFNNDVDFQSSTTTFPYASVCEGVPILITQNQIDTNIYVLPNSPNLTFNWSYTPANGGLTILNNGVSDSCQFIGNSVGDYIVRVDVTDANTGCSWYDIVDVSVSECTVNAGVDITVGCDPIVYTNDLLGTNTTRKASRFTKRRVFMDAEPTDATIEDNNMGSYWSMIRSDGTEWVFPNNCVPYDGFDEGDVFSVNSVSPCGDNGYSFPASSNALFNFKNAIDTVTFAWHVIQYDSINGTSDTLVDTVVVKMQDVDFAYSSYILPEVPWRTFCEDTLLIHQLNAPNFRPLGQEANLKFKWDIIEPAGLLFNTVTPIDGYIIDDSVSDSALIVTASGRKYRVQLEVTDTVTGCSWLDYVVIKRIMPLGIEAGIDTFACVPLTGDYIYQAEADIWYEGINSDTITNMSTWWSTIRDDGSEWIFPNNCVPYNGSNEGNVYTLTSATSSCNTEPNSGQSNAQDCIFGIAFPGTRMLIWNAYDDCTGEVLRDTILVGFGVLDESNAGLDETVDCNVVTLEGNLSSLSSANSGYYLWEQLSGPDSVTILSANANIGYFSTANLASGSYYFKYTLGLIPCQTKDTVEITVVPNAPLLVTMSSDYDVSNNYCQTDTINFQANGGQQYAFLVDGVIIQPFSPISTFSYSNFTGENEVTVLGTTGVNGCIETLDSAHVISVEFLPPPDLSLLPSSLCEGEQLVANLPYRPLGQYSWYGPNGPMNNDSLFEIAYVTEANEGEYLISYSENGCYSDTSNFIIEVSSSFSEDNILYACANDSAFYKGIYYLQSTSFIDSFQTSSGCDSIMTTQIVIGDTIVRNFTLCNGDSIFLSGNYQTTSGTYIDSYAVSSSCDSIVKTTLTVFPIDFIFLDSTICYGDSLFFANSFIKNSGLYTDTLFSSFGCDSITQLNLTVLPLNLTVLEATICTGDSLMIFNQYENQGGVYTQLLSSGEGCDSIIEFYLTLEDEQLIEEEIHLCEGDSILLENSFQLTSGVYYDTLASFYGCDSVIKSTLFVHNNYVFFDTVNACGTYFWNTTSSFYNETGNYIASLTSIFGCDSIINLHLQIKPIESSVLTLPFFCDSAFVNETWYYHSQVVIDTLTATTGCDSLVYTELEIRDCSTTANFSELYIPNVFTPNGDGINDSFIITSLGTIINEGAELIIYNRWGTKLFQSTTLMEWTGKNHSEGTYYYIFFYEGVDYTGYINLIRNN